MKEIERLFKESIFYPVTEKHSVSEQNRLSILNIQAELLTIHTKIDLILEWIAKQ